MLENSINNKDNSFKYDFMNYRFLRCNKVRTVERLGFYVTKGTFRKINRLLLQSKISKKKIKNKYNFKTKNFTRTLTKQKAKSVQHFNSKILRRAIRFTLAGKFKYYYPGTRLMYDKSKQPFKRWRYWLRRVWWDRHRVFSKKFSKNYFKLSYEMVLLNHKKIYVRNKSKCNILHINLTPNNITILLTKASGNVIFWSTSGTINYVGSRKRSFLAVKAVAKAVYKEIIRRKVQNLKVINRGKRYKIRMREIMKIFSLGYRKRKYKILALINMVPLPYNGCRNRKKRR